MRTPAKMPNAVILAPAAEQRRLQPRSFTIRRCRVCFGVIFVNENETITRNQKHRPATGNNAYRQDIVSLYRERS